MRTELKKSIATVIAISISVLMPVNFRSTQAGAEADEAIIYGDVCKDGKLNASDLSLAKKQLLCPDKDIIDKSICDLNCDGVFDISDIIELQDFLLAKRLTFTRSEIEPVPFGSTTTTTSSETTTTEIQYHYFHGEGLTGDVFKTWPTDDPDWLKAYDFDAYFASRDGRSHPALEGFYIEADLGIIFLNKTYGMLGFHEVSASEKMIKYENSVGDTITLTPTVDPDYPDDPNQFTSRVEWTYWDKDVLTTKTWVNSGYKSGAKIYYYENLTTLESGFALYPHFLVVSDMPSHYLPDGYTLSDGTFVSPERYTKISYSIDDILNARI